MIPSEVFGISKKHSKKSKRGLPETGTLMQVGHDCVHVYQDESLKYVNALNEDALQTVEPEE